MADKSLAVKLGRRGGTKGGPARAASLSPEERQALSRMAHRVRWAKSSGDPELSADSELLVRLGRLRNELLSTAEAIGDWEIELGASIDDRLADMKAVKSNVQTRVCVERTTVVQTSVEVESSLLGQSEDARRLSDVLEAHPEATPGELAGWLYGKSTPATRAAVRGLLANIRER